MTCCSNNSGTGNSTRVSFTGNHSWCGSTANSTSDRKSLRQRATDHFANHVAAIFILDARHQATARDDAHSTTLQSARLPRYHISFDIRHVDATAAVPGRPVSTDDRISSRFAASRPPSTSRRVGPIDRHYSAVRSAVAARTPDSVVHGSTRRPSLLSQPSPAAESVVTWPSAARPSSEAR